MLMIFNFLMDKGFYFILVGLGLMCVVVAHDLFTVNKEKDDE